MNELLDVSLLVTNTFSNVDFYFVQLQLSKIEQCATGSVYCQVMDAIYPGTFNLSKVKWMAKFDYEFVENYKVLQNAFDKNGIKKHIDVNNSYLKFCMESDLITYFVFLGGQTSQGQVPR